ncbi:type VI secretion system Vgr family protein [Caballeronia telluris]|uniref:Rhs element Vgr protein n=1 Tax=Caballeronia telluris TaxID=326475 RepID=A0A158GA57_9BURK|nr:type VI secretion system Vgr family protein [Caballeronia telluris]SAL28926.1 Rhs element Vgr protein [Caballeronia telluris]
MSSTIEHSGAQPRAARQAAVTGRQSCFLDVPGAASAKGLSVVSFKATERLGDPYHITIDLTSDITLTREDYLGRDATFTIEPPDASTPRTFAGCITHFSQTGKSKDFTAYRIVVEAHVARLRLTRATRVFQNKTAPQIIEAILRRQGFKAHQFGFKLRRVYPQLKFRLQYQTSDWQYIHILMQQAGLYCYIEHGEFGDRVQFADDIDHYLYQPPLKVAYREMAGLATGEQAVLALKTHSETIPESFLVADYNPDKAYERFKAEANLARQDTTTFGQSYVFGTHHLDQQEAEWEARLRHEAALAWQIVYEGKSNVLSLCPARILRMDEALPDAPHGQLVVEVTHAGARDATYTNIYKAIPAERRFRLRLEDDTWPKIHGTLSARITTPDSYKYAYLTQQGCYPVRFDFDFDEWPASAESVPLRLAKPFAGAQQTGFHFPLLHDTEVGVIFVGGNPNRPEIAHAHHHSQAVDLVTSQDRWMSRNVIRTQSNNKLRFEDWDGEQSIKLSTEYGGKTQLNLGYLVDKSKQKRGDGFELRSDSWGALRAGKGLFLSADAQAQASGQALDMQAAQQQLQTANARTKSLSDAVRQAKAVVAACEAQQALLEEQLNGLKEAVLLASAPRGMAFTSGEHLQLAAGGHLFATAGGNADSAVGGNYTVAAGQAVSLFANTQGMKLFAGKGKVEVQAQSDALELTALKGVTISSTEDTVTLNASKKLVLMCGGAYIKLEGSQVEIGSAGDITLKGPLRIGPSGTQRAALPLLPTQQETGMQLWHTYPNGEPVRNAKYEVKFPDGSSRVGQLDANGKATVAGVPRGGGAVHYFEEEARLDSDAHKFVAPDGRPKTVDAGSEAVLPSMTGGLLAAAPAAVSAVASGNAAGALEAVKGAGVSALTQTASGALGSALTGAGVSSGVAAGVAGALTRTAAAAATGGTTAAAQAALGAATSQVAGQASTQTAQTVIRPPSFSPLNKTTL